jgi:hypothetical protein
MARRKERLTIPGTRSEAPGERDNGKTFILTEMDAYAGQDWALRALLALARSGAQLPEGALDAGWGALAGFAFTALSGASYAQLRPLLDEMLAQATYEHDPRHPPQPIIPGPNCPIEEIKTFLTIQTALFKLHAGFFVAAGPLTTG